MEKKYSLKKNHEISNIIKNKQSVGNKYFAIYYRDSDKLKVAFSISKKYGIAVERNYGKRVVREIVRNNIDLMPKKDLIIVIKPLSNTLLFSDKSKQLLYLIRKIDNKEIKNEKQ